jgi:outer membrane protein assembly factor BamB
MILILATGVVLAGDQAQWGEAWSRNPVSAEAGLPAGFDPESGENVEWWVALGSETHSTPVVAGGRVLVGTNNGNPRDPRHTGDRSVLMCFDEKDGTYLWQLVVPKLTTSRFWDWPRSGICSTATVEGDRIYVVSNRGEVMCLDMKGQADGNDGAFRDEARHAVPAGEEPVPLAAKDADILWIFDMIKECGVRQHDQAHSSILLHGNHLYVNTSNGVDDEHREIHAPEAPSLVVVDKRTGKLLATDGERIGPRIFHSTWSSPALVEMDGRTDVVFCGGDGVVYGFEPVAADAAGDEVAILKRVWKFDCDPGAPKERVHRYRLNRKESPSNILSMPVVKDGKLYVTVGGDLWWGKNEAWLKCVRLGGTGDLTRSAELWSVPLDKHSMSTPAVADGLVYAADCEGNLYCVEEKTGRLLWSHEGTGSYWASPLVADGKVFIGNRSGRVRVFKAGREMKLLSEVKAGSKISATAVAANGVLYVATMDRLFAVGK